MTEIVRGQLGRENIWNTGQESGFIAYLRGSIGDAPQPAEGLLLGDGRTFDDSYVVSETVLSGIGVMGEESAGFSESTVITNS